MLITLKERMEERDSTIQRGESSSFHTALPSIFSLGMQIVYPRMHWSVLVFEPLLKYSDLSTLIVGGWLLETTRGRGGLVPGRPTFKTINFYERFPSLSQVALWIVRDTVYKPFYKIFRCCINTAGTEAREAHALALGFFSREDHFRWNFLASCHGHFVRTDGRTDGRTEFCNFLHIQQNARASSPI